MKTEKYYMYRHSLSNRLNYIHKNGKHNHVKLDSITHRAARNLYWDMRRFGMPPRKCRMMIWNLLFHTAIEKPIFIGGLSADYAGGFR